MSKKELRLSALEMEKLGISLVFPQYRDAEAEASSRRVVACLNACAGISTENLEDNKPIIELANDYNAVLKQRDMLLDVLKQIAKVETHGGDISASWTLISVKHLAQGVVEKVKGGAA